MFDLENPFSMSKGTKVILLISSISLLFFSIGYALKPVSSIIKELDDDEKNDNDEENEEFE